MVRACTLESWKEISVYLKRSIRTCRRWEHEFGLPVHRFDGNIKSRVFANTDELDRWIKDKLHIAESSESVHSIAVLPLRNLLGDPAKEYFVEGITEGIVTELGQISNLRVISHQSVRQFKNTEKSTQDIARQLGVDALVEGSVSRLGNRLCVTANLIWAAPERHLWARIFYRELGDVIGVQHEIVSALAQQIRGNLPSPETGCPSAARTVLPEAYDAYFRGRASVRYSFLKADIERALAYYEKALKIDPNFAPSYAEIAWCYGQLAQYSYLAPREAYVKLKEMSNRALELDSGLSDGHAVLGLATAVFDWNWPEAERLLKRALELNPNNQRALYYYAQYLNWVCRPDESVELQQHLIELDPLNPESHWNLGWCFFWCRRYDEAAAIFNKLLESSPDNNWLEMALGMSYIHKGLPKQGLTLCDKARPGITIGIDGQFDCFTAYTYAKAGKKEKAHKILREMICASKDRLVDATQIATVLLSLGNYDEAFAWFERAYRERSPMLVYLKIAPFFESKRDDPRFQALISRMNFPE